MLFYPGFEVLNPFILYRVDKITEETFHSATTALANRLDGLFTEAPIPFRRQNFGDYHIPELTLKDGLEIKGSSGFGLHCYE
jgi:NAD(P)H dehydrogenase (quinone)